MRSWQVEEGKGAFQLTAAEISLGTLGPHSLAGQTQRWWHKDILDSTSPRPEGWSNQLDNEITANFYGDHYWRRTLCAGPLADPNRDCNEYFDAIPRVGIGIGTMHDYASVGMIVRFGIELDRDCGPPKIRPGIQGTDFRRSTDSGKPDNDLHLYLFAGAEGRAVLRDATLDGGLFRPGPDVQHRAIVGDGEMGLAIGGSGFRLSATWVNRSKEFYGQQGHNNFGVATFTYTKRFGPAS